MDRYNNRGFRQQNNSFGSGRQNYQQRDRQFRRQEEIKSPINEEEAKKILNLSNETAKEFDELADKCAKEITKIQVNGKEKNGVSYSKLRDFYAYVKDIKEFDRVKLYLMKPKLAYAVGKESDINKKNCLEKFQKMMNLLINNCDNEKKFNNLKEFFEAIVGYCRVYNPKGD